MDTMSNNHEDKDIKSSEYNELNVDFDTSPTEVPDRLTLPKLNKDAISDKMYTALQNSGIVDAVKMYGYTIDIGCVPGIEPDEVTGIADCHMCIMSKQVFMWKSTKEEFENLRVKNVDILGKKLMEQDETNIRFIDDKVHDVIHNFIWRGDNTVWYAHTIRSVCEKPKDIDVDTYVTGAADGMANYIKFCIQETELALEEFIKKKNSRA